MEFEAHVIGQSELKVGFEIPKDLMHVVDDLRKTAIDALTEQARAKWTNNWSTAEVIWFKNPLNWDSDVIVNSTRVK